MNERNRGIHAQAVDAPPTKSATFLVLSITDAPNSIQTVRSVLASIDGLTKTVAIRDNAALFTCTVGIGSDAWDRLIYGMPRPAELHPFPTLLGRLGDAVSVVDQTVGFRYFDTRDLLGFVDGTANPVGPAVPASVLVAEEDETCSGGSYVVVQKYTHNMKAWSRLPAEKQEAIIGRTKLDNVELDDAKSGQEQARKSLATIEDDDSVEHDILRDNMPFGSPGSKVFGTYFIGYSRRPWVIERMLERMFVGVPPGKHDRLLDYSTPQTGTSFFAPSATVLASLGSDWEY